MFICDIGTVQSYLENWGKRVNFGNSVAKILTKVWERKDKWCDGRREKKFWISIISLPKFLLPNPLPARINARSAGWSARKGNQLWQPSRRNCRGVRREIIRIVTTKLSKMGGKKRKERERERERIVAIKLLKTWGRNLIRTVEFNKKFIKFLPKFSATWLPQFLFSLSSLPCNFGNLVVTIGLPFKTTPQPFSLEEGKVVPRISQIVHSHLHLSYFSIP